MKLTALRRQLQQEDDNVLPPGHVRVLLEGDFPITDHFVLRHYLPLVDGAKVDLVKARRVAHDLRKHIHDIAGAIGKAFAEHGKVPLFKLYWDNPANRVIIWDVCRILGQCGFQCTLLPETPGTPYTLDVQRKPLPDKAPSLVG